MKTSKNSQHPCKLVETVAVLQVSQPLPEALETSLGYAGTAYWRSGDRLYILNCALADVAIFCSHAMTEHFLWGKPDTPLGKYQAVYGRGKFLVSTAEQVLYADCIDHALPIYHPQELMAALDERRTFLSRGQHRRMASQPTL